MPKLGLHSVLDWLRRSVLSDVSCGELLDRYIAHSQDSGVLDGSKREDAFAELVRRHGPKVYGVCRRILGDHQLAEDAFQATFVVLAKRASSVRPRFAVGGFLYGVAHHAALKASAMSRRHKEKLVSRLPDRPAMQTDSREPDVLEMLDEEIENLSPTYRAAVVICEIDGMSRAEAAKQLGIAEGTLSVRLARAREQLRKRLLKRGVSFSAGMMAALTDSAQAAVPLGLKATAANITASAVPHSVAIIAHGVLKAMILSKLKSVTMFAATMFLASGLGIGFMTASDELTLKPAKGKPIAEQKVLNDEPVPQKQVQDADVRMDAHGDPFPEGALKRLGTVRLRASDSQVAISADGKNVITVGQDLTVRIWDAQSGIMRSIHQVPSANGNG